MSFQLQAVRQQGKQTWRCLVCMEGLSALEYNIVIVQQLPLKHTCQLLFIVINIVARNFEICNARFRYNVPNRN